MGFQSIAFVITPDELINALYPFTLFICNSHVPIDYKYTPQSDFINNINLDLESQIKLNQENLKYNFINTTKFIKKAKEIHDELEKIYSSAVDFNLVDQKTKQTLELIEYILN